MTKTKNIENLMENFYKLNISNFVANHFVGMGYSKATAYRKINRLEEGFIKIRSGSGRPAKIATAENIEKIKSEFNNKSGGSQKMIAEKYRCGHKLDI